MATILRHKGISVKTSVLHKFVDSLLRKKKKIINYVDRFTCILRLFVHDRVWRFNNVCLRAIFCLLFKVFLNLYTSSMWDFPHRCCRYFEGKNCIVMGAREKKNQTWLEKNMHLKKRFRILAGFYVMQIVMKWCSQNLKNSSGTFAKKEQMFQLKIPPAPLLLPQGTILS